MHTPAAFVCRPPAAGAIHVTTLLHACHKRLQQKKGEKMSGNPNIDESKKRDSSTQSFQQSYETISYEVIRATSIKSWHLVSNHSKRRPTGGGCFLQSSLKTISFGSYKSIIILISPPWLYFDPFWSIYLWWAEPSFRPMKFDMICCPKTCMSGL